MSLKISLLLELFECIYIYIYIYIYYIYIYIYMFALPCLRQKVQATITYGFIVGNEMRIDNLFFRGG